MIFKVFWVEQCDVMPEFHKLFPNSEILKLDPIMVSDMLQSLNPHKSQGPNDIHPFILKCCALSLSVPICLLFQRSLDFEMVPLLWKQANITPAHKSGSKLVVNKLSRYFTNFCTV